MLAYKRRPTLTLNAQYQSPTDRADFRSPLSHVVLPNLKASAGQETRHDLNLGL